ncbi:unnamed protein product [Soboliphyme baturini]|uniref:Amidohydro-rel domain-containing protein n=1 Tax=Soboliphyme baturini TaxID=241478 RepID=A0A183J8A3_9BILA|nr:unnamed protein product [Soboliphyme baturini]
MQLIRIDDRNVILIKGGTVVNCDLVVRADVLIRGGKIKQVEPDIESDGAHVIIAEGKYVMPGGVDPHTHLQHAQGDDSSAEGFFAGTQAAVAGGTTTIVDSVIPAAGESLIAAFEKWKRWADPKVCCDYALSVAIRHTSEKTFQEMETLCRNNGVNSFLFYMDDVIDPPLTDGDLYRSFKRCRQIGALPRVQPANGEIIKIIEQEMIDMGITGPEGHVYSRPENLEAEAVSRVALLSNLANCPLYVLRVASKGATKALAWARKKGYVVTGEVLAASFCTDSCIHEKNVKNSDVRVTCPPLRFDRVTPTFLINRLAFGDLEMTASDHSIFNAVEKAAGISDFRKLPKGINGVQERMMVTWEKGVNSGKFDLMRFVAVSSTSAAKVFNMYPRKGRIAVGSDADIVIWDPEATRKITARNQTQTLDMNVFEGQICKGVPLVTICGGRIVYENGQVR